MSSSSTFVFFFVLCLSGSTNQSRPKFSGPSTFAKKSFWPVQAPPVYLKLRLKIFWTYFLHQIIPGIIFFTPFFKPNFDKKAAYKDKKNMWKIRYHCVPSLPRDAVAKWYPFSENAIDSTGPEWPLNGFAAGFASPLLHDFKSQTLTSARAVPVPKINPSGWNWPHVTLSSS